MSNEDQTSYVVMYRNSDENIISTIETVIGTKKLREKLISEYNGIIDKLKQNGKYERYFTSEGSWPQTKEFTEMNLRDLCFNVTQFMIHIAEEAGEENLMCNIIQGKLIV
jgi:hypothetical protein